MAEPTERDRELAIRTDHGCWASRCAVCFLLKLLDEERSTVASAREEGRREALAKVNISDEDHEILDRIFNEAFDPKFSGCNEQHPLCDKVEGALRIAILKTLVGASTVVRREALEECAKIVRVRDRPTDMLVRINALKTRKGTTT